MDKPKPMRAAKCWEGRGPRLVWQVQWRDDKAFLIVDAQNPRDSVYLQGHKPDELVPQGSLVNLLRKYARTSTVQSIAQTKDGGIVIHLQAETPLLVYLDHERPRNLHLIDINRGIDLIRSNSEKTYTKPKPVDTAPILNNAEEIHLDFSARPQTVEFSEPSRADSLELPSYQKELRTSLKKRLKTVRKSFAKHRDHFKSDHELEILLQEARLLQNFAHLVKPEQTALTLAPEFTGLSKSIQIELDPEVSIGANIERLFIAYKKHKKAQSITTKHLNESEATASALEHAIRQLDEMIISPEETRKLRESFGLKPQKAVSHSELSQGLPYRTIYSSENTPILVGKGPHDNDLLTKSAKSNDYWFHAIGSTGSHVIVPAQKAYTNQLPEAVKREAAILAIHFSKLRQDCAGECYMARKHGIKKKKGMPPGLWLVERAETIFVKYSPDELKALLGGDKPQ